MKESIWRLIFAVLSLPILGCASTSKESETNKSYLIVDARSSVATKQPDWIALFRGRFSTHIRTGGRIEELSPGVWKVAHVDFGMDHRVNASTLFLGDGFYLELEANKIYYLGMIDLQATGNVTDGRSRTKSRKRSRISEDDFTIVHDIDGLEKACAENPEVFARYPLVFPFAGAEKKQVRIDC